MGSTRKKYFEEMEENLKSIRSKKEPSLIGTDKHEEFIELYNFAEHWLWELQEDECILNAYKLRAELWKQYQEKDREYEKAKGKRALLTILGFTIAYYFVFLLADKPTGIGIILTILPALFAAGIHFWANTIVFTWLNSKGREEQEHLDYLKKEIQKYETKTTKERCPTNQSLERNQKLFEQAKKDLENF